ncbi:hypothetical protein GETHLI_11440 [Geothrix limicola]|uniref:PilZ domain-containing protein n=1 Tax=Geothrix limicola TaxID=2927978 RepID=A0ABQ5QD94_9BACT|nr:PilZ domain-containing protein [Geothrix limicola]GLH72642.1 hypothetical protein GETHLI_11440 [Geothrix limicola]
MTSSADQRAYERLPFSQKVRVVSAGRVAAYAMVINIGMGGILLGSTSPLPVGSQCKVAIPVPDGGGIKRIVAEGTVVRGDSGGTAVKFAQAIEPSRFEALFRSAPVSTHSSLLAGYLAYFEVSRDKDLANCEKLLGVSKRAFRTTFYITFCSCISLAILPVWLLRSLIPAYPNWIKIALCFGYGAIWLAVIQPSIDLSVFHFLKHRRSSQPNP